MSFGDITYMKIEHVAMYAEDLERAKEFFIKYFNAVPNNIYHNTKTDFRSYFLSFDDGARLEIMNRPYLTEHSGNIYMTGYAHIAFSLGSSGKVDRLTAELKADGYKVISEPRTTGDGYYESCIVDLEGNLIELTV